MVGQGFQAGCFQGGDDAPIGLRREIRRGGLHHNFATCFEVTFDHAVHRYGVEFAEREVGRVWQIDDDHIKLLARGFQPFGRVGVVNFDFGIVQRLLVQAA